MMFKQSFTATLTLKTNPNSIQFNISVGVWNFSYQFYSRFFHQLTRNQEPGLPLGGEAG